MSSSMEAGDNVAWLGLGKSLWLEQRAFGDMRGDGAGEEQGQVTKGLEYGNKELRLYALDQWGGPEAGIWYVQICIIKR